MRQISPVQIDATLLANNSQHYWELLHLFAHTSVAKSFTGFKLCSTTPNNMQHGVQTGATCNIQQFWEL